MASKKTNLLHILVFAIGFLLTQSTLVFADAEHPLHDDDSACVICKGIDHFSKGLGTFSVPTFFNAGPLEQTPVIISYAELNTPTTYSIRAPPHNNSIN